MLPQRYQLVNASSPLSAGVKLLAYAIPMPFGILFGSVLTGKRRMPFVYPLLFGATLQTVGFALMSTVPTTLHLWSGQYGYSAIAGLGVGISVGSYYVLTPIAGDKQDQREWHSWCTLISILVVLTTTDLALGLGLQARMFGGAVGIAVVNSIWLNYTQSHLASVLSASQIRALLGDINVLELLSPNVRAVVRSVCGDAYNLQMRASLGFTAAQFLVVLALWRRHPIRLSEEGTLQRG